MRTIPILTYRGTGAKRLPLVRAVVDPGLRLPPASRLLASAPDDPLVIYTRELEGDAARAGADVLRARGADVVPLPSAAGGRLDLVALLEDLGSRKINGLIVEGGPETAAAFVERRLVDKVTFFVAPKILGGRDSLGAVGGGPRASLAEALELGDVSVRRLGDDVEITGYPRIGARGTERGGSGRKISPPDPGR